MTKITTVSKKVLSMIIAMVIAVVAYNVLPPELAILEWRG